MKHTIAIPIEPVPWTAAYVARIRKLPRHMLPARVLKYRDFKKEVQWRLKQAYREPMVRWLGVRVDLYIFMRRPKSHYRTGRFDRQLRKDAPSDPITTPDRDNLQKAIIDCGNGILWHDDNLVTRGETEEHYVHHWEQPGFVFKYELISTPMSEAAAEACKMLQEGAAQAR